MNLAVPAIPWTDGAPTIPTEVAQWIWNEAGKSRRAESRHDGQPIPEGGRNNALASLAGSMRRRGMSQSAITAALMEVNDEQCRPPLDDGDVRRIAQSVCRYEADDPVVRLFEKGQRDPVYDEEGKLEHRLQVATLRDLYATESPGYEPLLGPYIIRGLRTLIGAGTGEGKTTILMHMLKAVVNGGEFLGEQGVGEVEGRRPKILIIDAEQSLPDIQRLADETGLQGSEDILYISAPDGLDLAEGSHDAAEVEEILEEERPDILVVDPLYKAARIDSNDERQAVDLMRLFDRWRAAYGFAFVMPVHTRKGLKTQQGGQPSMDDIFGSGAFSRGAEIILGLRRPGPGFARLYIWKHRPGMIDAGVHIDMRFERTEGFTRMDRDEGKSRTEMVVSLLALNPEGMTIEEIAIQMGLTKEAVRHAIRASEGQVKSDLIPGTRGKKLFKAVTADEGDMARWEAMLTNGDF
jgi:KaiC/GvpD/RAD55 family RecA-like ATPase